ncbi:MAG: recombinase family protein, partial [Cyanobacteria bacterium P01_A01_bin.135]
MAVFAYQYCPSSESQQAILWPQPVDRVYQDIGGRSQLAALYADCCRDPQAVGAVIVPRFADLGDSL